jgi:hypothetical protein
VVIDGRPYAVSPTQVGGALRARVGNEDVMLPLWSWAEHREALGRHLRVRDRQVELDDEGYAREVLDRAGIDPSLRSTLVPLALWWASGCGSIRSARTQIPPNLAGAWVDLAGGFRARVRGWTWRERLSALRECVVTEGEIQRVDPLRIIEQLLATTVLAVEHHVSGRVEDLGSLDVVVVHQLLEVLLEMSMPGQTTSNGTLPDDPGVARRVLHLCRRLGWTPSQVLATPAAEIDALIGLLELAETGASGPSRTRGRIHGHPDAVVLMFEQESES